MSQSTTSQTRRFGREWLALGIFLVLLGVVVSWELYAERDTLTAQESERLQSQARVIHDNLIWQLEGANSALRAVRDEIERWVLTSTSTSAGDQAQASGSMPAAMAASSHCRAPGLGCVLPRDRLRRARHCSVVFMPASVPSRRAPWGSACSGARSDFRNRPRNFRRAPKTKTGQAAKCLSRNAFWWALTDSNCRPTD